MTTKTLAALGAVLALIAVNASADPLGTAFTYQGQLTAGTSAANGVYDFQFAVYDTASGPNPVAGPLTINQVAVNNGLFNTVLDFGPGIFAGAGRWLDIAVRTNGGGAFTPLSPRQPLTPSPYTLYAPNAGSANVAGSVGANAVGTTGLQDGAVTAAKIAGGNVVKTLNGLKDDISLAPGANLTLTPSGQTLTLASPTDWHVGGNAGTTPGVNFLGTTDNQPLELYVNGTRALRLEPNAYSENNVLGGASVNTVSTGTVGSTISGGGSSVRGRNVIAADFSTIGGGYGNTIATNAVNSTIGGGYENFIATSAGNSTIGGGGSSVIASNAFQSTIGGGLFHHIREDAADSTIAGGWQNEIQQKSAGATIAGGFLSTIQSNANASTIGGGSGNVIQTNAIGATIGGGTGNTSGGGYATVPGGQYNLAGGAFSFAAGQRAKAAHQGAFVWSDSQAADFSSTANDQFLIRAGGNVGINKNNPATALDVNGTVTASGFSGPGAGLTGIGTISLADNSVTAAKLASDANSLSKVTAGTMTASSTAISLGVNLTAQGTIRLNDNGLLLRGGTDANHGLSWRPPGTFAGVNPDGPVLYGCTGGTLGTMCSTPLAALNWDNLGRVMVDPSGANSGSISPGLSFGLSGSAEGIASKRTSGGNQYGLDFYTAGQPRLSIDNVGRVGIGTTTPNDATLDVHGDVRINDCQLLLRGDRNHGVSWRDSVAGFNIDGPFIYGYGGGALGIAAPDLVMLKWNFNGNVWVSNNLTVASLNVRGGTLTLDDGNLNNGTLAGGIVLGGGSGEGLSSKRTSGGNQFGLDFYTSFVARMSIANNGNVGIGRQPTANRLEVAGNASKDVAGSWLANSDARIKTDVQPVTDALDKLDKVRLVSFRYTDDYRREHPSVESRRYVNVVAQEFRDVFPDEVKSSGEHLSDGSEILQVDTYPLTIYSAAAVQELNRKMDRQATALQAKEDELQALRQRVTELEKIVSDLAGRN